MSWGSNKRECNRSSYPTLKSVKESKLLFDRGSSPTSWYTCTNENDVYYDAADAHDLENGSTTAPSTSKLKRSSSLIALLQKIHDPEELRLALRSMVDTAKNLLGALEVSAKGNAGISQETTIMASKVTLGTTSSFTELRKDKVGYAEHEKHSSPDDRTCHVDWTDGVEVTVEPIAIAVPLTLYLKPRIIQERMDRDPVKEEFQESSSSDQTEPIRTATILAGVKDYSENSYCSYQVAEKESVPEPVLEFNLEQSPESANSQDLSELPGKEDNRNLFPYSREVSPVSDKKQFEVDRSTSHSTIRVFSRTSRKSFNKPIYRSTASKNDRYGDHSNLSKPPNTKAYADPRQQPAGPKQQQQKAKDNHRDDTKRKMDKRQLSDQYFSARGNIFSPSVQSIDLSSESFITAQSSEQTPKPSSTGRMSLSTKKFTSDGSFHCQCEESEERCAACCSEYKQIEPVSFNLRPDSVLRKVFLEASPNPIPSLESPGHQELRRKLFEPCLLPHEGRASKTTHPSQTSTAEESSRQQQNGQLTTKNLEYWIQNSCRMHSMNRSSSLKEINPCLDSSTASLCVGPEVIESQSSIACLQTKANPTKIQEGTEGKTKSTSEFETIPNSTENQCPWSQDTLENCCKWILNQAQKAGVKNIPIFSESSGTSLSLKPTDLPSCDDPETRIDTNRGKQRNVPETSSCKKPSLASEELLSTSCVDPENHVQWTHSSTTYTFPNCSNGTATTPRKSTAEKLLPILKNIYDMLQVMKDERLRTSSAENSEEFELASDEPLPPPPTPPITPAMSIAPATLVTSSTSPCAQCIQIASIPPINLFITPIASQQGYAGAYIGVNCEKPPSTPSQTQLRWFDAPQHSDHHPGMDVLDPPERDLQNNEPCTRKKQKLIPVDMDLLRTDDDFDWKPWKDLEAGVSKECQVNMDFADDIARNGDSITAAGFMLEKQVSSKEIQVNGEDLPAVPIKSELEGVSCQSGVSTEVQVDLYSSEGAELEISTNQEFNECKQKEAASALSSQQSLLNSSDGISDESVTAVDNYSQPTIHENSPEDQSEGSAKTPREKSPHMDQDCSPETETSLTVAQSTKNHDQINEQEGLAPQESCETPSCVCSSSSNTATQVPLLENMDAITYRDGHNSSITTSDAATDRPEFDQTPITVWNTRPSAQPILYKTVSHLQEHFIESIISDLKAIKDAREHSSRGFSFSGISLETNSSQTWDKTPPQLSYPLTIEKVQEMRPSSLFVKWKVYNVSNIAGYEVFLDGHITNRYFSHVHRAVVICQVNLQCPHRIIVRAQPQVLTKEALSASKNNSPSTPKNPGACCPQPDGTVWYPSVYHFQPNVYSAPTN